MAITGFDEVQAVNFEEVPVYWAKVLPGQEESFGDSRKETWKVDIAIPEEEMFEQLLDAGFNVKEPDKKKIRAGNKADATDKEKMYAEIEEKRGNYVRAVKNKYLFGKDAKGKQTDDITKEKTPPLVVDRKQQPWPADKYIGNGSICNVQCVARYFQGNQYITLYLVGLQVVEHVELPPRDEDNNNDSGETDAFKPSFKTYED